MKNTIGSSIKFFLISTLILGVIYPFSVYVVGKLFFSRQVDGSIVRDESGMVRGSTLIAQKHEDPKYFHARPSAADFNAASSGASNLSLTHKDLKGAIETRKRSGDVSDALFTTGSGLDPEISLANARAQADRVATARKMSLANVLALVEKNRLARQWYFLGEERVNVMSLNLALDGKEKWAGK